MKAKLEGHTIIIEVAEDCEPIAPPGAKMTFVNQCGYVVRENIPISIPKWKATKATDTAADIVPQREKEM